MHRVLQSQEEKILFRGKIELPVYVYLYMHTVIVLIIEPVKNIYFSKNNVRDFIW